MSYGAAVQNHPDWQDEPDPHLRSQRRYGGATLHSAASAMSDTSRLIHSCWPHFDAELRVCMVEIEWSRPTTGPEQRSAVAKAAVAALRTWLGSAADHWTFRAKSAKRLPLPPPPRPAADESEGGW